MRPEFTCLSHERSEQKRSHWSIAWSDLMMTMFILFLCLFVFQTIQTDFLLEKQGEILAGERVPAKEPELKNNTNLPFPILFPGTFSGNTIQRADKKTVTLPNNTLHEKKPRGMEIESQITETVSPELRGNQASKITEFNMVQPSAITVQKDSTTENTAPLPTEIIQPAPLIEDDRANIPLDRVYADENEALSKLTLREFGTVELVPDQAVRIVLTADLLFDKALANLSPKAVKTLEKIALAIRDTKNQIHIEGHTDDLPIQGGKYANNWELSLARAYSVAIFLMEDMLVSPDKITVSGFASHRPLVANTSELNRAKNRRVEIIISKQ